MAIQFNLIELLVCADITTPLTGDNVVYATTSSDKSVIHSLLWIIFIAATFTLKLETPTRFERVI